MGALINGLMVQYSEGGQTNQLSAIVYDDTFTTSKDFLNPSQNSTYTSIVKKSFSVNYLKYQGGDWTFDAGSDYIPKTGELLQYRTIGPIVENDYHLNLCDYAIYMASAKKNPELSMSHLQIFETRMQEILIDNLDKELPMGIKEEI